MLNQKGLLLACLAVALSPAVSRAVPLAATQTVQLQPPSNVRVRPTIIGKINKSPSISCNEIVINATLHPPGGFPVGVPPLLCPLLVVMVAVTKLPFRPSYSVRRFISGERSRVPHPCCQFNPWAGKVPSLCLSN